MDHQLYLVDAEIHIATDTLNDNDCSIRVADCFIRVSRSGNSSYSKAVVEETFSLHLEPRLEGKITLTPTYFELSLIIVALNT